MSSSREQPWRSESGGLSCSVKKLRGLSDPGGTARLPAVPKETVPLRSQRRHDAAQRCGSSEQSAAAPVA